MQGVSKNFYLGSCIAAGSINLILLLIGWIVSFEEGWDAYLAFSLLRAVPVIYQIVIWLVLLYKAWAAIQDGQTPVSPGKAIGFLFIPFYSLYWVFRAVWGLAREFNAYAGRHAVSTPRLTEGIFLAYCVLSIVGGILTALVSGIESSRSYIPLVTGGIEVVFSSVSIIVGAFIIAELCGGVNALASSLKTGPQETSGRPGTKCLDCGKLLPVNAKFCSKCGRPVEAQALQTGSQLPCPNPECRHSNPPGSRFCGACGTPLTRVFLEQVPEVRTEFVTLPKEPAAVLEPASLPALGSVKLVAVDASARRSGDRTAFQLRVEAEAGAGEAAALGGVTINVPTVSEEIVARTKVTAWAAGADRTYCRGPGQTIQGFRDDHSFGEMRAKCLLIESVRERWNPGERVVLEATVAAPLERLEIHVRTWATWKTEGGAEETRGDPDWSLAEGARSGIVLDQQRIPAYRLSLGF